MPVAGVTRPIAGLSLVCIAKQNTGNASALDTQWLTFDFLSKRLDISFIVHRNMLLVQGVASLLLF